jgi:porin
MRGGGSGVSKAVRDDDRLGRSRDRNGIVRGVAASLFVLAANSAAAEDGLWQRERLTGDWGGARSALADRGVTLGFAYINETFDVLRGGLSRGGTYEGRGDLQVDVDLEKLAGWTGGAAHVRVFQMSKGAFNITERVGSIPNPSNIEATSTTRLFTAWFEQRFGPHASLRLGQLAADDEFANSAVAGGLINGAFGWPPVMSSNLPSSGPAFPLAALGARLQVNLTDRFTVLAGVFSGDPAGRGCYDTDPNANPQACNKHGTKFQFTGGAFWIGEAQYQVNQGKDAKGLAAAYKLGVWYHTADFADQRYGIDGTGAAVSLATGPSGALLHRGNWGVYGVVDQMIWRGAQSSVSVFARGGFAPDDRNLVSWYAEAGVGVKGPLPGRADDTLTIGVARSNIGHAASDLDRDTLALNGAPYPIRSSETIFEVSYIFQVAPWWSIQPDLQYIVRPGGNVPDPNNPAVAVGNAFLAGLRSTILF